MVATYSEIHVPVLIDIAGAIRGGSMYVLMAFELRCC